MKIIRNSIIPFEGFKAVNLFGLLFIRKNVKLTTEDINHEYIHTKQILEMLYIPFYIWYLVEYLILRLNNKSKEAYKKISFEKEAFLNEDNFNYLDTRIKYNWLNYLGK